MRPSSPYDDKKGIHSFMHALFIVFCGRTRTGEYIFYMDTIRVWVSLVFAYLFLMPYLLNI